MDEAVLPNFGEQQNLAAKRLPSMVKLARSMEQIAEAAFTPKIAHNPLVSSDLMVLAYTTKQSEHMRSMLLLIEQQAHRDAALIGRSMLEGLAQLQWAYRKYPERTDIWYWYGLIEDWRQMRRNMARGHSVSQQDWDKCQALVQEHGPKYYSSKSRERIRKGESVEALPGLPDDPYQTGWNSVNVRSMMEEIGGLHLYDSMYRHASGWIHWNPQTMLRAINQVSEAEVEGFTEVDWVSAIFAMQSGCRGLGQSLVILDEYFALGISDLLVQAQDQLSASMKVDTTPEKSQD